MIYLFYIMYEYILVLKGTNKAQSIFEFENLWNVYYNEKISLSQLDNTYFFFRTNNELKKDDLWVNRLTFTNFIYEVILQSHRLDDFKEEIKKVDFSRFYDKNFSAKIKKVNFDNNEFEFDDYLKPIWKKFENPQVNLKNPDFEFFYFHNNNDSNFKLRFAFKIFENTKNYLVRMPKLRPVKKPYTLKSDMARAAINYLNIKNGVVLDPFCGIGGILLEAYDMDFEVVGNDINYNDLKHMKTNFDYFFPDNNDEKISRSCADSRKQFLKENSIDGIVTDIPYGKSSRLLGEDLYDDFLKMAKIYLKPNKRIVVIYANFTPFKDLALKYFSEVIEIEEYINKSMTRYILVLENSKL